MLIIIIIGIFENESDALGSLCSVLPTNIIVSV